MPKRTGIQLISFLFSRFVCGTFPCLWTNCCPLSHDTAGAAVWSANWFILGSDYAQLLISRQNWTESNQSEKQSRSQHVRYKLSKKKNMHSATTKTRKKNGFSLGYGALGEESEVRENEKEMCEKTGNRRDWRPWNASRFYSNWEMRLVEQLRVKVKRFRSKGLTGERGDTGMVLVVWSESYYFTGQGLEQTPKLENDHEVVYDHKLRDVINRATHSSPDHCIRLSTNRLHCLKSESLKISAK